MKQPKLLFLLVGFIALVLFVAAADAKSQLPSPQAAQGGTPLPIAQTLLEARHWGGWVNALVVDGSYAYLNVGREVQVYSLTDPADPTLVGSLLLDDVPSHLAVSGNYLYVGHAHSAQLKIIDISDPTAPVWLGSLNLPTEPQGALWWRELTSSGNNAFVITAIGLYIIDVSDPSTPYITYTYTYSQPQYGGHAIVIDHYLYAAISYILHVFDISNPAAPVEVHSQHVETDGMVLVGNYLYVFTNPTLILDVTNPAAPQEAGTTIYTGSGYQALGGNYLYLFSSPILTIVNITNPLEPVWMATLEFTGWIGALQAKDGYFYVIRSEGASWLITYDTATPANPVEVSNYLVSDFAPGGQIVLDELLYVFNGWVLEIFDIANPLYPAHLSTYHMVDTGMNWPVIAVQEPFIYLLNWQCGGHGCQWIEPFIDIVDVTNPLTPTQAGGVGGGDLRDYGYHCYCSNLKISGHYLFLVSSGTVIYNITNPAEPGIVQTLPNDWLNVAPIDATAVGDYIYLAVNDSEGSRVIITDFSDPAIPTIIGTYQTTQPLQGVDVVDSYLYVREGGGREVLRILDISNPAAPTEVNTYHPPWYVGAGLGGRLFIEGNYLYLGHRIFDISDPANPTLLGFYPLGGDWVVEGDNIYTIGHGGTWYVLKQIPVMVTLTPSTSATLTYGDYQGLPTTFDFPAASVTEPITIAVNPSTAEDINGYAFARHTFGLSALRGDVQLPTFTFSAPVTITLRYSHDDVGVISNEAELALWVWTENGWQDATTTCHNPAPYLRDVINNVLTLTICQTGRFALFGPTHQRYFPFIDRR